MRLQRNYLFQASAFDHRYFAAFQSRKANGKYSVEIPILQNGEMRNDVWLPAGLREPQRRNAKNR